MVKKNFLSSWIGEELFGSDCPNKWKSANGSSLSEIERRNLLNGHVVIRPKKDKRLSKIFVMDELNELWALIIATDTVDDIKSQLRAVGYKVAA